jgi:hypothetical protein
VLLVFFNGTGLERPPKLLHLSTSVTQLHKDPHGKPFEIAKETLDLNQNAIRSFELFSKILTKSPSTATTVLHHHR